jgi:sugar phosphate isomerase/epimerase
MAQIALQLYTLREPMATDPQGTLRAVAALGYRAVELAGLAGMLPAELRATLDGLSLTAPSMHAPLARLDQELDAVLDEAQTLGCAFVVCPWIAPELRNPAGYAELVDTLVRAAPFCAARGLHLCYHHHDFEFAALGEQSALEYLLDSTEAAGVQLEADVYWAAFAGHDPAAFLRWYRGRVALVHLKDMAPDRDFAEVGHGTLDMPAIIAAATEAGARWLIVEQDRCPRPPLESVRLSLEYLEARG